MFKTGSTVISRIKYPLIYLLLLHCQSAISQQKFNVSVFGGFANYSGELQQKSFTTKQAHAAGGISIGYEIIPRLTGRGSIKLAKVSADDKFSDRVDNRNRNLNFYSSILEFSLSGEFDLFDLYYKSWTPYVTAGIAAFRHNPHANDVKNLRQFSTEGQGFVPGKKRYGLINFAIPVGGGIKFRITENIHLGYEIVVRKTFTDYIDDVSTSYADAELLRQNRGQQAVDIAFRTDEINASAIYPAGGTLRGSPGSKDWYYMSGLSLYMAMSNGAGKLFKKNKNRGSIDCPVF